MDFAPGRYAAAALLAAGGLLSACGNAHHPFVGAVTTLAPRFCVGRHNASGDCFAGATPGQLAHVRVGDCVTVTSSAAPPGAFARTLVSVAPADPAKHRADCPGH